VSRAGIYSHSGAQRQDIFLLVLHTKLMTATDSLTPGLGQFPSSQLFRQNNICMCAAFGSQHGATTLAAESSAPLTREANYAETRKSKNSIRNRNFKRKITCSLCVGSSDLSSDTKKHTIKSRETIPLRQNTKLTENHC
jgi:hypothetical protein